MAGRLPSGQRAQFSADERAALLAERNAGTDWASISALLRRSDARLCQMQADRISRPHEYTETEIATICRMRRRGCSWDEIALVIGHVSGTGVRIFMLKLRRAKPRQTRACMTCRSPFTSHGLHNRMCAHCRARADSVSPYEPDGAGAALSSVRELTAVR